MKTSGSLGGKNTVGRYTGARSSRARLTLFKKLRNLDRRISQLDARIQILGKWSLVEKVERGILDEKRKEIRLKRKAYKNHQPT